MPKKNLTDPYIRNYPKPDKRVEIYDEHTSGLAIRITTNGSKSFVYRYRFKNKVKRFTIGRFPTVSLAEARKEVGELEYKVNHGTDPLVEKKAKKDKPKSKKFDYLVKQFKKKHLPKLKASTQKDYTERIDNQIVPAFKGMELKYMTRHHILEFLEEIAYGRNSPIQSNRVRAILSSMYSNGVQWGIAEINPVKTIKPLGEENERDRVLDEKEIYDLWHEFLIIPDPTQSLFKLLLILGQRKGETRRMEWNHLNENIWTIPKEQTKADRKHFIPLPPMAGEIIENIAKTSPYVFESRSKKGHPIKWMNSTFNRAAKRAKVNDVMIHDLRRTAATHMAELGTDRTILGKVLNHKGLAGDTQVTARYDRYSYMDEKTKALKKWSEFLQEIISGDTNKNQ
jgi:integrase